MKRGGEVYLDGKKSDLLVDACIVERTHDADPAMFHNSAALGNDPPYWLEAPQNVEDIKWPRVGL